ncbi:unnamed protein product [Dovyalis caffra]|uniref:N-acetyltransferase domain-containing protein n=1 Tax=Dovyalis caffra TaxID=77055 RepID=A0AAV1RWW8_9ROSI|nr:unnamed protein product [Dovyalis caffra]
MDVAAAAMTIKMKTCCGYGGIKTMEIRWATRKDYSKQVSTKLKPRIPIFISTNPSHINPQELRDLYSSCNHSCHRFPRVDNTGKLVEPVDIKKLSIALSHSALLVSVFCNTEDVVASDDDCGNEDEPSERETTPLVGLGDLLQRVVPFPVVSPSTGKLVGFGRAVSDYGLTASIFDVMVIPSLQGMGIGKMIVKRIIRILTSREIYDIAALCSADERLFFKACGFGDDIMGSTTMMYTRTLSTHIEGDPMVKHAGRKLLLAPPLRKSSESLKNSKS